MNLLELWSYRHLIAHKAWADFRAESKRTYLGVLWWILDPIINTVIYYFVFGVFLQRGGEDYVSFLMIGIVGWFWFSNGVSVTSRSIWANANLVQQISHPKSIFPCMSVLLSLYRFAFSLIVLLVALIMFGQYPQAYWLYLPLIIMVELLFIAACGFLLASVVPFVPDMTSFVPYFLRFGFFLSCVMYRMEAIPEAAQAFLVWNPMVHVLYGYRDLLIHGRMPDWPLLTLIAVLSLFGVLLGQMLIHRFDGIYAKRMMQ